MAGTPASQIFIIARKIKGWSLRFNTAAFYLLLLLTMSVILEISSGVEPEKYYRFKRNAVHRRGAMRG
ncbi:MAG: hypothetical protein L0Z73_14690 [Gammaproteobacteria bacterium]|nr:hypothetical protein [Gammaproteobacteria bacterium]